MNFALNEVQAMVTKAARGSGLDWNFAADAGRAARWLERQGLDGCGSAYAALGDEPGTVSPILTGAWCVDHARQLAAITRTETPVRAPVMFIGFAAQLARLRHGQPVGVEFHGSTWCTDGHSVSGPMEQPSSEPSNILLNLDATMGKPRPFCSRATPDPEDWAGLERLAALTYAPATDASRASGAGAGVATDND
jgi:hypothetical protein